MTTAIRVFGFQTTKRKKGEQHGEDEEVSER